MNETCNGIHNYEPFKLYKLCGVIQWNKCSKCGRYEQIPYAYFQARLKLGDRYLRQDDIKFIEDLNSAAIKRT